MMTMSMAKRISTGKPSTIDHAPLVPQLDLSRYGADLESWPRSWMGWEKDLPPAKKLVPCFRPFIEHLASSSLPREPIRKHLANPCILGGETIRNPHNTPPLTQ